MHMGVEEQQSQGRGDPYYYFWKFVPIPSLYITGLDLSFFPPLFLPQASHGALGRFLLEELASILSMETGEVG